MSVTKKDFIAIASILKNTKLLSHEAIVLSFCDYFKEQNPLFDEFRFKEACGL